MRLLMLVLTLTWSTGEGLAIDKEQMLSGYVQSQDLRRIADVTVELRDREGALIQSDLTSSAGEFFLVVPHPGIFSVRAIHDASHSQYSIVEVGKTSPPLIVLTLAETEDIALDIVSSLPAINPKSSGTAYAMNRQDLEVLPRGNNLGLDNLLRNIPSAVNGGRGQIHIRQEHANMQVRVDGIPIPDTISSVVTDLIPPRTWEHADVILGGLEAEYGNRTAAVIDISTKQGTKAGFGSLQVFGGANDSILPSFEYGGMLGERFRFYVMNNYENTNRGIDSQTLGNSYHNHAERNHTVLRGDYQLNNQNNFTWLLLSSIGNYQIPTKPGQSINSTIESLIQASPGLGSWTAKPSEDIDENQLEHNQYSHLVWRHNVDRSQYFSLAAYLRHSRATFTTDPYNVLVYTSDTEEPFSAGAQDRWGYAGGIRFDYTHLWNSQHVFKAGFQVDRTQARNETRLTLFARDSGSNPTGIVTTRGAGRRVIGFREEIWLQDQYTPTPQWTFNLGLRLDNIHGYIHAMQISPRIGTTYKLNNNHVFHAFYGRLFTPPNLEALPFGGLNTANTTAAPDASTQQTKTNPERSHYFELGSTHEIAKNVILQLTGYYKLSTNMSDAHQFNATPMLNYFAYERGWQRGLEGSLRVTLAENLTTQGNVAWGQCKGYGLQSGHFLMHEKEYDHIRSGEGVFCDHMQSLTSTAWIAYRLLSNTTITAQMLYGSGLRMKVDENARTNSYHTDSQTMYNLSVAHVIPLGKQQKLLFGLDIINLLDQEEYLNKAELSIGMGVTHANMPRSIFFRTQYFF